MWVNPAIMCADKRLKSYTQQRFCSEKVSYCLNNWSSVRWHCIHKNRHQCYEQRCVQSYPTKYYFLGILTWQLNFQMTHFVKHQHTHIENKPQNTHASVSLSQAAITQAIHNRHLPRKITEKNYPWRTHSIRYSSRSIILNFALYRCNNSATFITREHVRYSSLLINTDTITTFLVQYSLMYDRTMLSCHCSTSTPIASYLCHNLISKHNIGNRTCPWTSMTYCFICTLTLLW